MITFKVGKAPPSNKPPPPKPTPSKSEFPFQLLLNETDVFVSIPKPDKISIVGDVLPQHFAKNVDKSAHDLGPFVTSCFAANGNIGIVKNTKFAKDKYWNVLVDVGAGAAVNFTLTSSKSKNAVHSLRWELNPARVGADVMFELLNKIHAATDGKFYVGSFLADARITRLDIAIDVVGLAVSDLIVTAKSEGKRVRYFGADEVLETEYIHGKKKPVVASPGGMEKRPRNALGRLIVRIYDRVRERNSVGLDGPFGLTPVTRIEISKTRFGNKTPLLVALPSMVNPFTSIRVGHIHSSAPEKTWRWLDYLTARRASGPSWAARVLGLSPAQAEQLEGQYREHPSDVLDAKQAWLKWAKGLEFTGTEALVLAAKYRSKAAHFGYPFGDDPQAQ